MELDKDIKIGFIGNINSMPMHYALDFKKEGYDVKYIVESLPTTTLMRPECHFAEISYPYPKWIKELTKKHTTRLMFAPRLFFREIINEMKDRDVIFFNDYGHSIAPYFNKNIIKISLFSGSDLDVMANPDSAEDISNKVKYKFLKFISKLVSKRIISNVRNGIRTADIISYFPIGMNPTGDKLIEEIMIDKAYIDIRRLDVNFKAIDIKYCGPVKRKKLILMSGVRILIHPDKSNLLEYKGNDIIIKGIAEYYKLNKNIEVHFIEKGPEKDIRFAKKLCANLGIEKIVKWFKPLPTNEFIKFCENADVCFDQVGSNWIGAVGAYALFMGKPLIANARLDLISQSKYTNEVLNAESADEICKHLIKCESYEYRKLKGLRSHEFAKNHYSSDKVYQEFKRAIATLNRRY